MSRSFCYKRFRILFPNGGISPRNSQSIAGSSQIQLSFDLRLFSSHITQERPSVISYLIDSCGLSAKSAKSISKKINFKNPNRPDLVLSLLKQDYGFTVSEISKIVKKSPHVLLADPVKTLLPKLQFFSSIAGSSSHLRNIVSSTPQLLCWSLNDKLIPSYNMLKTVLRSEKEVIQSLRCSIFGCHLHKYAPTNIEYLRKLGVSEKQISGLLISAPFVLSCSDANKFIENVNKVIDMGFHPEKESFAHALNVISRTPEKARKQKIEAYKSWGLSEEEILSAFRKYPYFLSKSVKKITGTMDFLLNKSKMNYRPADVIIFPAIVSYSLEKRIIPRFSVIRVLQLKGHVKENISISTVMRPTEELFMKNYVIKYEAEVPHLRSVYRRKKSIQELV